MDNVISFTPSELVAFITTIAAACAGIATITGVIIKVVMRMKKPELEMRASIKALEAENEARKEEIKALQEDLQNGTDKFTDIEKANRVMLKALQALLAQSLGADATEALTDAKKELDKYLIEK